MICGTTPTIVCNVNIDLREWDCVRMTISDGKTILNIDRPELDLTDTTVSAILTQEQTLSFRDQYVNVQLKAKHGSRVAATNICRIPVSKILCRDVI